MIFFRRKKPEIRRSQSIEGWRYHYQKGWLTVDGPATTTLGPERISNYPMGTDNTVVVTASAANRSDCYVAGRKLPPGGTLRVLSRPGETPIRTRSGRTVIYWRIE